MEGKTEKKERIGCRHTTRQEISKIKTWWKTARVKRIFRSKEHGGEQLLPGIPDDITLDLITPKLPWEALRTLVCVSRSWQEVIRTKQVYEARVRSKSTETLILHPHDDDAMALYSTSEKCCYELPPIPGIPRGILYSCECIALDGKVYVLGGLRLLERGRVLITRRGASSREVYVLDLARLVGWKQCASMLETRHGFGCGVMDGKIYVFGGTSTEGEGTLVPTRRFIGDFFVNIPTYRKLTSEVYDTQENAWCPIVPLTEGSIDDQVAAVGKELFLYTHHASTLEVYNTAKNDWRLVKSFWEIEEEERLPSSLFITNEKFYLCSQFGIDVYDAEQNSWINRHANSFGTVQPHDSVEVFPSFILAVKDELLLEASLPRCKGLISVSFHCKGFESEKTEMVWQETTCSRGGMLRARCSIQL